jgi:hypothetical protein
MLSLLSHTVTGDNTTHCLLLLPSQETLHAVIGDNATVTEDTACFHCRHRRHCMLSLETTLLSQETLLAVTAVTGAYCHWRQCYSHRRHCLLSLPSQETLRAVIGGNTTLTGDTTCCHRRQHYTCHRRLCLVTGYRDL